MKKYSGQCECGEITFVCDGDPLFTQYCHCNKCREIASLSLRARDKCGYALTAAYLTSNFHIISSVDKLQKITRNNSNLFLCKNCHCLIYGISIDPDKQGGIGVNINNFNFSNSVPESFKPLRHIWYINHIVDFADDLPKFKDAPKEQFGSGELLAHYKDG